MAKDKIVVAEVNEDSPAKTSKGYVESQENKHAEAAAVENLDPETHDELEQAAPIVKKRGRTRKAEVVPKEPVAEKVSKRTKISKLKDIESAHKVPENITSTDSIAIYGAAETILVVDEEPVEEAHIVPITAKKGRAKKAAAKKTKKPVVSSLEDTVLDEVKPKSTLLNVEMDEVKPKCTLLDVETDEVKPFKRTRRGQAVDVALECLPVPKKAKRTKKVKVFNL